MIKIKCPLCGKTLLWINGSGTIEIKCTRQRCGKIIKFEIKGDESVRHTVIRE